MGKKIIKPSRYSTKGLIEDEYEPGGKVLKNKRGIRKVKEIGETEGKAFLKTQGHFYRLFVKEELSGPITEGLIRKIHRHWLGGIYEWAGCYRQVNLGKDDIVFPPAFLQDGTPNIPKLMKEFEKDILKQYTPCGKGNDLSRIANAIAIVHGEFEMIHPFREGNGRIGRLIADLMALQAGYPPLLFDIERTPKNKGLYFTAMKEAFVGKNHEPLKKLVEKAMELGIKKAKE